MHNWPCEAISVFLHPFYIDSVCKYGVRKLSFDHHFPDPAAFWLHLWPLHLRSRLFYIPVDIVDSTTSEISSTTASVPHMTQIWLPNIKNMNKENRGGSWWISERCRTYLDMSLISEMILTVFRVLKNFRIFQSNRISNKSYFSNYLPPGNHFDPHCFTRSSYLIWFLYSSSWTSFHIHSIQLRTKALTLNERIQIVCRFHNSYNIKQCFSDNCAITIY